MKSINEIRYEFLRGMNMLYEGWGASHVIEEAKTIDSLRDVKAFNGISDNVINWILDLDPTYKGNEYVGKYTIALLDKYINGELEGLSDDEIKSAIKWFNSNKSSLPSDNRNFKSVGIRDIIEIANSQLNYKESDPNEMHHGGISWPSLEEMAMKEKSARILEVPSPNENYRVFYPLTWEASNKIAGSPKSRWCTANSDKNWFNEYFNRSGGTYIFTDMNGTPRYNYSPGHDKELADIENNHISINSQIRDELNLSSMASTIKRVNEYVKEYQFARKKQLQKRIDAGESLARIFDDIWNDKNGLKIVKFDGEYSYLNSDKKLIGDGKLWFKNAYGFKEGFAPVQRDDGKWSFIDARTGDLIKDGQLWLKSVGYFYEGFAQVQRDDGKWSFIDTNINFIKGGQLWFEWVYDFSEGFARVQRDDGKCSFIDARTGDLIKDGQLWFRWIGNFHEGFAQVQRDDGKWSFIDTNINFIKGGQLWFELVYDFSEGFASVICDDGKYYNLDKEGNLYEDNF